MIKLFHSFYFFSTYRPLLVLLITQSGGFQPIGICFLSSPSRLTPWGKPGESKQHNLKFYSFYKVKIYIFTLNSTDITSLCLYFLK